MAIFTDGVHLISDTSVDELHDFAQSVGIPSCWFHSPRKPGTFKLTKRKPHYDLTKATKQLAINAGAKIISPRQLVKKLIDGTNKPKN